MNKSRRQSYADEDIEVKPSTELIADEYEHFQEDADNRILVHTFASDEERHRDNESRLTETLAKYGYDIKPENRHNLEEDNCFGILDSICRDPGHVNGLILFFSGHSNKDGEILVWDGHEDFSVNIQEIWNKFNTYNCKELKNKPKIFIFEIEIFSKLRTDGKQLLRTTYELAYDTPAEADILIVYNKLNDDTDEDFVDMLCDNIDEYGKNEDIVSLVTCIDFARCRPMIISTLTRKFYFTASEARGYHLEINNNHEKLTSDLREVHKALTTGHPPPKKEKNRSFFRSFRIGKNKTEKEEEMQKVAKNKAEKEARENITIDGQPGSSTLVPKKLSNSSISSVRRKSNVQNPPTSRTRTLSQTEGNGSRSSLKKPPWKN